MFYFTITSKKIIIHEEELKVEKEKFMEFISRVLDMDAKIEITFHTRRDFTENAAKEIADEFAQIVESEVVDTPSVDYKSRWYSVRGKHCINVWHENSKDKKLLKEHLNKLLKDEEELA